MTEITREKLGKAIAKARKSKNFVRAVGYRRYEVRNPEGVRYEVRFEVRNGRKFGECNCVAGQRGLVCYHMASAAAVNVAIASMRAQAERPLQSSAEQRAILVKSQPASNGRINGIEV